MNIFTNSALSTFRLCPRQFYYKYIECLDYKNYYQDAIDNGNMMEYLINKRHRGEQIEFDDNIDIKLYLISQHYNPEEIELLETDIQLHYQIQNGIFVTGLLDSIVKRDNETFIMDIKSSSRDYGKREYNDYWKMWEINRQVMMYSYLAYKNDIDFDGFIVNWIKIPGLKHTAKLSDEEYAEKISLHIEENYLTYYVRMTLPEPESYQEIEEEILCEIDMIQMCSLRNVWPRTAEACDKFWYLCQFMDLCTGNTSIDQYAKREHQHQELSQELLPEIMPIF